MSSPARIAESRRILLDRYGIARGLTTYHEHNAAEQRPKLLAVLAEGKSVALMSDAGTPLLSDPGYRLVLEAAEAGHSVFPIPGASALLAGLVAAGLPTDAFFFAGFLPPKEVARRKRLAALSAIPGTLIFYELPHRLGAALADMAATLGDRPATVARELTKAFETVRRGTLVSLAAEYAGAPPKGEIVVLVGPPSEEVARGGGGRRSPHAAPRTGHGAERRGRSGGRDRLAAPRALPARAGVEGGPGCRGRLRPTRAAAPPSGEGGAPSSSPPGSSA